MCSKVPWTEPTGRGPHETREIAPTHCPAGHALTRDNVIHGSTVQMGWYLCRTCGLETQRDFHTGEERIVRAMARQAEAEREKRVKIINAEGESLAAAALGDASDIMMAHPWLCSFGTCKAS